MEETLAMTPEQVYQLMLSMIVNSSKQIQAMGEQIATRSMNALNVIEDVLVLQHGGPGDDAGLIAALQAAAGVPSQGAIPTNK